jgi:succinate dehydrogenase / fumarate reductase cytochrome b subunit
MSSSKRPMSRPMSPYMLGPYYKFQITSLLSILNRLTGVFMSVISAPLLLCWLIALATGDAAFAGLSAWLGSLLGKLVVAASVFSFSFHLLGGIRHLIWDAGWMMEMQQVNLSGWLAIIGSVVLTLIVMGAGL